MFPGGGAVSYERGNPVLGAGDGVVMQRHAPVFHVPSILMFDTAKDPALSCKLELVVQTIVVSSVFRSARYELSSANAGNRWSCISMEGGLG